MCDRYFSNLHPITTVRNEIQKLNEQNIFPPSLLFDQRLSYLANHCLTCNNYLCQRTTVIAVIKRINEIKNYDIDICNFIIEKLQNILDNTAGGTIKKCKNECLFYDICINYLRNEDNEKLKVIKLDNEVESLKEVSDLESIQGNSDLESIQDLNDDCFIEVDEELDKLYT